MLRLDAHIHIGEVYGNSRKTSPTIYVTPQQINDYITLHKVTHCVLLYGGNYSVIQRLKQINKTTVFYPLQWVYNTSQHLDQGISGVKLHSRRGPQGVGLDYTDTTNMFKLFKRLEPGSIVYFHTQPSAGLKDSPRTILTYALKYPQLKFVICHAGAFGLHSFKPVNVHNRGVWGAYYNCMLNIAESIILAKEIKNIKIQSSLLFPGHYKNKMLVHYGDFMIGTDYPFTKQYTFAKFDTQQKYITKINENFNIQQLHQNGINFLENKEI